jgi:hypothetical protein
MYSSLSLSGPTDRTTCTWSVKVCLLEIADNESCTRHTAFAVAFGASGQQQTSMRCSEAVQLLLFVSCVCLSAAQFSDTPCPVAATDFTEFRPDEVARIQAACGECCWSEH